MQDIQYSLADSATGRIINTLHGLIYVQAWRPVAEAQLRLGGANLAALLNQALGEP
ncbi:hypothetical protein [Lysobacter sp. A378]